MIKYIYYFNTKIYNNFIIFILDLQIWERQIKRKENYYINVYHTKHIHTVLRREKIKFISKEHIFLTKKWGTYHEPFFFLVYFPVDEPSWLTGPFIMNINKYISNASHDNQNGKQF